MRDYKDRIMDLAEEIAGEQHDGAGFYDLRGSERTRIWQLAADRVNDSLGEK